MLSQDYQSIHIGSCKCHMLIIFSIRAPKGLIIRSCKIFQLQKKLHSCYSTILYIMLQYHPIYKMVLQHDCIIKISFLLSDTSSLSSLSHYFISISLYFVLLSPLQTRNPSQHFLPLSISNRIAMDSDGFVMDFDGVAMDLWVSVLIWA